MRIADILSFTVSFIIGLGLLTSCQPQNVADNTILGNSAAIIGGQSAATNEFPFIVNIWLNSPKDAFVDHLCGGSLIHKKWVLTAAHCVLEDTSDKSQGFIKLSEVSLYMGSDKISGQGGRELKVKSILVHPKFSWPKHDIALIELAEEVTDITPVLLNQKDLNNSTTPQSGIVAGWGLTDAEGKVQGETLQKVTIPLISRKACTEDSYPQKRGWIIGTETLCASSANDTKAACPGDSGGPLVQLIAGHYTQIGVVSWGTACRSRIPDFKSNVQAYADVSDAYDWIESIIK